MIETTLEGIRLEIAEFLKVKLNSTNDDILKLGAITPRGTATPPENVVLMSLIRIEEEKITNTPGKIRKKMKDGSVRLYRPPLKLKLYVLFSGLFNNYVQSINGISNIVSFLQFRNVFDQANAPGLPPEVKEVTLELVNQTPEEQNQLWGMLGSSMQPSVLFRLRTLVIDEEEFVEPVTIKAEEIEINVVRI